MFLLLFLFIFNHLVSLAQCLRNVTVDDNNPQIQYTGDWGRSATTDLNFGGSHVLTTDPTADAVFQFTGVAVYFLSPLWPYAVSTALSLDSRPTVTVDLTDHSTAETGGGPETVGSTVVWSAENLANTTHTLRISVGRGQQFAIVDGIIYTVPQAGDASSTSTRNVADPTFTPSNDSSESTQNQVIPIVLGTLLGVLALILIALIIWICLGRRKDNASRTDRRSGKWSADATSVSEQGGVVPPLNPPLSPTAAPRSPPPASRPGSNYQPGETAWSTSSVGGPGVPNMTGIGASVRSSRAASYHPGEPGQLNPPGHFGLSQGSGHTMSGHPDGPYVNPNRDSRYPDI